jgi:hypothetical protein
MTKISNQRAYIPDEEINGLDYLPGTDFDQALKTVNFRVQDLGTHYNQVNGVRNFDYNFYAHSGSNPKPADGYFYSNSNNQDPNNITYFIFSKKTARLKDTTNFFESISAENPFDLVIAQKVDINTTFFFRITSIETFSGYYKLNVSEVFFPNEKVLSYTLSYAVFNLKSEGVYTDYVPYTSATQDVDLGTHSLKADSLEVSTTSTEAIDVGKIVWNEADGTFDMGLLNGVILQSGQEIHMYAKASGSISNGDAVQFDGAQGDHLLIKKAVPSEINDNPEYFIGIATQDFANNEFGYVTVFGQVRGLNTTSYTEGTKLYFDSTSISNGLLTDTRPTGPNAKIIVAAVVRSHITQGSLFVRPHAMPKIGDLQNTEINNPIDGQILKYNATNEVWENVNESGLKIIAQNLTDSNPVTGTISNTTIETYTIPANTFEVGDTIILKSRLIKTGTNGVVSQRPTIAEIEMFAQSSTATNLYHQIERQLIVKSETITEEIVLTSNAATSNGSFLSNQRKNIDWSLPQTLTLNIQNGHISDSSIISFWQLIRVRP